MRTLFLFISLASVCIAATAQNGGPTEITAAVLQKLTAEVEKQVPAFRAAMAKKDFTAEQIEFAADTFRIEQIVQRRMDIDYSTMGMNQTVDAATAAYDKLLNKYYNKLLKIVSQEDKKVLIAAQKAWISFRDAEQQLIWTMGKEEYSGGGTIQSNIATGAYAEMVTRRTVELFNYYDNVIREK